MEKSSILLKKLEDANKLIADQKYALDQAAIVAVTDKAGVITHVNDKFCVISGYSEAELIGNTHRMINSRYHDRQFFAEMWKTITSGQVWSGEICNRAKGGDLYWVDTTIVPFLDRNQQPYQYIAVRTDITLKKKAKDQLEKDRLRLFAAEKMASLGVLSAGISHELGNPLGALRGRAEMLERIAEKDEPIENAKVKDSVSVMLGLIDRMTKIIRGLRAYARDGSKDSFKNFDIGVLVSDIVEISKDRCRKHEVDVTISGADKGYLCRGRESEIGQVVVNLFNNAVDAARTEAEKWIHIEVTNGIEGYVQLKVTDSGPGIPQESLLKIFDPFFTSKEVGQGTGLGLSICKAIIEDHEGFLEVSKNSGHTCFEVLIPKVNQQL